MVDTRRITPNRKGSETRAKIIRAAVLAFGTNGFDGTTLADIAQSVKDDHGRPITAALIAHHFRSPDGLATSKEWLYLQTYKSACTIWAQPFGPTRPNPTNLESAARELHLLAQIYSLSPQSADPYFRAAGLLVYSEFTRPRSILHEHLREALAPFGLRIRSIVTLLRPDLDRHDFSKIVSFVFGVLMYPVVSEGIKRFVSDYQAIYDSRSVDVTVQMMMLAIYTPQLPIDINMPGMIRPGRPCLSIQGPLDTRSSV